MVDHLNEARAHVSNAMDDLDEDHRAMPQLREAAYHLGMFVATLAPEASGADGLVWSDDLPTVADALALELANMTEERDHLRGLLFGNPAGPWIPIKPEGAPYWGIRTTTGETVAGTASGLSEGDARLICNLRAFYTGTALFNPAPPTNGPEVIQQHLVTKFRDGHTKVVDITPQPTTPADESGVQVCTFADCTCDALHTTTRGEPIDTPTAEPRAAAQEVVIEAVGRIVADDEQGRRVDWLTEGGIAAMEVGDFMCVTNAPIPDDGLLTFQPSGAGEDAARLDWLEANGCEDFMRKYGAPDDMRWYDSSTRAPIGKDTFPTLRAAIDAASRARGESNG